MSPRQNGFTAVVLTYDRVAMLFRVLVQVAQAPSLAKVCILRGSFQEPFMLLIEWFTSKELPIV